MLNTLSARATFYDIIGYLIPGFLALLSVWLWLRMLGFCPPSSTVNSYVSSHWMIVSIVGVSASYIAGHAANAFASLLLEKHLFAKQFAVAKNWQKRLHEVSSKRESRIRQNCNTAFGFELEELQPFDLMIRMEEYFPQATISGFSFLCFYGMSRTVALLTWIAAIPVGSLIGINYVGTVHGKIITGIITSILMILLGRLFVSQYLRFVRYYFDFLCSTLLVVESGKCSINRL